MALGKLFRFKTALLVLRGSSFRPFWLPDQFGRTD
jgi:hypothetical protein